MKEWCLNGIKEEKKTKMCVVLGSGGHTMEMLHVMKPFDKEYHQNIEKIDFIIAESDTISSQKIEDIQSTKEIHKIPRSRKVGQSYFTSIFTTLYSLLICFQMMFTLSPEVLVCNGPGTCVPVCLACWFFNLFKRKKTKIIYLESVCRVTSLSLTGKIIKPITNIFVVQWEELCSLNKKALVHHFFYSIE